MSSISSIPTSLAGMPTPLTDRVQPNQLLNTGAAEGLHLGPTSGDGFGKMLDGLVSTVDAKQVQADGVATYAAWGPVPFRLADGNILFPVASEGGWRWKDEYVKE